MMEIWAHRVRLRSLFQVLLIALLVAAGMLVPAAAVSADPGPAFRGEYYNNTDLTGSPVMVRDDVAINFDWGTGSPGGGVNSDNFSVNWTAFVYFAEGNYNFHVTVDDGVRLWVDDQLLIDEWRDQPSTTFHASKYLGAGYHSIRLAYYERGGFAVCKLWWDGGAPPITEWRGEYYGNTWLGGSPIVRNDAAVSFDWGSGAPIGGIGSDNFSVRWTRDVYFAAGTYTFYATVDDGVRVWVGGALIIDKWYPQSRTTHSAPIYLNAGTHQVRVEYFEQTGAAVCIVNWTGGPGPGPGYEIIVDDRDPGFIWGGPAGSFYSRATGYRGALYWTWNSTSTIHHWGKWFPHVTQPGNYTVYAYIASRYFGSKSARYVINLNGVQHTRVVNQNNYYNQWVSLGTYYFGGGSGEYVFLGDATGEAYATRYVGFDAMKFVKQDGGAPPPPPPPSGCPFAPVLGFGRVWSTYPAVRAKIGCPSEAEKGIWAGEQVFSGGYMFWRQDQTYIYVLYNNGTWQGFADTWTSAEPEWDPSIVPPPGYYQPKRGFGKVWRNNANVRNALGWALIEERGINASAQAFTGGQMLWSPARGIYVLCNDGTWQRYN